MRCRCCGAADLVKATRDVPAMCGGKTMVIPAVTGDFCAACGEVMLNREEGDRFSALLGEAAAFFGQRGALASKEKADKA